MNGDLQWKCKGLFAIPLIKILIDIEQSEIEFLKQRLREPSSKDKRSKENLSINHFGSGGNILAECDELLGLGNKIKRAADFAYRDLLNHKKSGPLQITSSWANLCEVGGQQPKHNHANSCLSGTLYLKADENSSIKFTSSAKGFPYHNEIHDEPDYGKNEFGLSYHFSETEIGVSAGDCLLWPSYLVHGYQNNQTPGRLSLSFNCMPQHLNSTYQLF